MLCVDEKRCPAEIKIDPGRLSVAVGETCKSLYGRGRAMALTSGCRRSNPDVITASGGGRRRRVFSYVQVSVLVESHIVRPFEIGGCV